MRQNAGQKHLVLGSYPANAFGLFDMRGNMSEWCEDDYVETYNGAPADGSAWVNISKAPQFRITRGGGWLSFAAFRHSASRGSELRSGPNQNDVGFRLARTASGR
jgi:formylglycine-generating enzyme required for sulfatase activity